MDARKQAIFITGAASGIGRATAELFAERGWLVGAADRDAAGLEALAGPSGGAIVSFSLDVTDRAAVLASLERFAQTSGGRLDCIFANAGIDAKGAFAEMEWAAVARLVEINLLGAMSVIHAALPMLRATPGSLCLATASGSAIFGVGGMAAYSATKRGVRGLIEALSVELAPAGVRAADLLPGIVDTGMLPPEAKAALPSEGMWRPVPASAVAEAAWAAYHGDPLHLFVPGELEAYDHRATAEAIAVRDGWRAGRMP